MAWRTALLSSRPRLQGSLLRGVCSFRFLPPAADPPGDFHVGLVGRDREAAAVELFGDTGAARRFEIPQLVRERRLQLPSLEGGAGGGEAAAVRPHFAVIRTVVHGAQAGLLGVRGRLGPDWDGQRWILPIRLPKR